MSQPAVHVAALVVSGNDFLMLRQQKNWVLPATAVRYGETLAEAVVRALGEQVGVAEAICGPFIGWSESIDTDTSQSHTLSMYFRAVLLDSTTQPASQTAEVRWIPSWDAAELGLADGLAEFLAEHGLIETLI